MDRIKLCVAGSRHLHDQARVEQLIVKGLHELGINPKLVHTLINGKCPYGGVDACAETWARRMGIQIELYPGRGGKGGFPARNKQMAQRATHAILIYAAHHACRGTQDMHTQWIGVHGATADNIITYTIDEEGSEVDP
jgi:hypothetical protein